MVEALPQLCARAAPPDAGEADLAAQGAADLYALKISQARGLLPTLRAAAVADAAGVGIYGGTLLEGSVGSIAAAHVIMNVRAGDASELGAVFRATVMAVARQLVSARE